MIVKTRSTTVFLGIQGEIRTAGTRTPKRSNLNSMPVPVLFAGAVNLSGAQVWRSDVVVDSPVLIIDNE